MGLYRVLPAVLLLALLAAAAAAEDKTPLYVDSSPGPVIGAGWFRGYGLTVDAANGPVFAWREISSTTYMEGPAYLAVMGPGGFLAARIGDRYTSQLSVPAPGPGGAAAAAYARYGGSTRLDVYLGILYPNASVRVCRVASTGSWEEYPATAWLQGRVTVFFYNSSDRSYYLAVVEPGSCSLAEALKAWDGSIGYRDATQVASGQSPGSVAFAFRDGSGDPAVYVAVYNGSSLGVYMVANTTGSDVVGRRIAYNATGDTFLLPVLLANGTVVLYAVSADPAGGVLYSIRVGDDAATPPTVVELPGGGVAVVYANRDGDIVVYSPSTGSVVVDSPETEVDQGPVAGALNSTSLLVAWSNDWRGYLATVNLESGAYAAEEYNGTPLWGVPAFPQGVAWSPHGSLVLGSLYVTGNVSGGMHMLAALLYGSPVNGSATLYTLPGESRLLLDPERSDSLTALIRSANTSIVAALAFFENMSLAEELVAAAQRGVHVVLVTDDDSLEYPAVRYMIENGVEVYTDRDYENSTGYQHTMHHKFIVVDGRHVVIGTANPTTTGLGANYENVLIARNATLLAAALAREALDLIGGGYGTSDTVDVFAGQALYDTVAGDTVSLAVYAGPEHRLDWQLETVARLARSSISMAEYIFTTSSTIKYLRSTLLGKANQTRFTAVFDWLMNEDTPGRFAYELVSNTTATPAFSRGPHKMHAKTLVVDSVILETGSYNPTGSATRYNDESIILVYSPRLAGKADAWIRGLYRNWSSPVWNVDYHPLIASVGVLGAQYIAIMNPTDQTLNLSSYLIGDAETVFPGDTEGLYRFPSNAALEPGGTVIVARNATRFLEVYGFLPDYEILDTRPEVPQVSLYLPGRFQDNFSLDPAGDEAVLAMISPYSPDFLYIVDMLPYGNSTALPVQAAKAPTSVYPGIERLGSLDSLHPALVTAGAAVPPRDGVAVYEELPPMLPELGLAIGRALLKVKALEPASVTAALFRLHRLPEATPVADKHIAYSYDVVVKTNASLDVVLEIASKPVAPGSAEAYLLAPNGTWVRLEAETLRRTIGTVVQHVIRVKLPPHLLNSTLLVVGADPPVVGGESRTAIEAGGHRAALLAAVAAAALAAAAATARRRS